ncbi:MAG: large conductance mechanosensitive channel protein MscL [Clostridiaceae bacterium]|jgi:large conductance mechanosensitive channel|nr:large conductance mechanosensitive channel protein MscL [Clostridiaceae bacterium]
MWKDLKAFLLKGNVIDLAVAVVIGAAFGAIVNSLVKDVIMPVIGQLISGIDLAALKIVLESAVINPETMEITTPEVAINIGLFINAIVQFVIIGTVIFFIIRGIQKLQRRGKPIEDKPEEPAPRPDDVILLEEIRDLLKKQG